MRALVVHPPRAGCEVVDVGPPERVPGTVRVSVVECGVCGTDHDIAEGKYGRPPSGQDRLILGHENLGQVAEVGPEGGPLSAGDYVVATVRRGCGECRFCAAFRSDCCETGRYTERGILGADGYIAEEYVERPEYLVQVPATLRNVAVLLEPLSVVEKACQTGQQVLDRKEPTPGFPRSGTPSALVAGTGAIGTLAAFVLTVRGYRVSAIDRHDGTTAAARVLASLGAEHVNAAAGLAALGDAHYDLVIEASGSIGLDFGLMQRLRPNGVLVLTGIPDASAPPLPVAGGALFREMVLANQAVVGSVNGNRLHFEAGVRDLTVFQERWPGLVETLVSSRVPLSDAPSVLAGRTGGTIKTVLQVRAAR